MNDQGEILIYGHPAGIKTEREWIGFLGGRERAEDVLPDDAAFAARTGGRYAGIERYSKIDPKTHKFEVPMYKTFGISVRSALESAWKHQIGVMDRIAHLAEFVDKPQKEVAPMPVPRLRMPVTSKARTPSASRRAPSWSA